MRIAVLIAIASISPFIPCSCASCSRLHDRFLPLAHQHAHLLFGLVTVFALHLFYATLRSMLLVTVLLLDLNTCARMADTDYIHYM